jgi:ribosome-associated protein
MIEIKIREEYITLGQAIKAAGFVGSGSEAKEVISNNKVKVNCQTETQRGKKLYDGDIIEYEGKKIKIVK